MAALGLGGGGGDAGGGGGKGGGGDGVLLRLADLLGVVPTGEKRKDREEEERGGKRWYFWKPLAEGGRLRRYDPYDYKEVAKGPDFLSALGPGEGARLPSSIYRPWPATGEILLPDLLVRFDGAHNVACGAAMELVDTLTGMLLKGTYGETIDRTSDCNTDGYFMQAPLVKTTVGTWANSQPPRIPNPKNYRDRDNNVAETPSIDPDIVEALGVYHVHGAPLPDSGRIFESDGVYPFDYTPGRGTPEQGLQIPPMVFDPDGIDQAARGGAALTQNNKRSPRFFQLKPEYRAAVQDGALVTPTLKVVVLPKGLDFEETGEMIERYVATIPKVNSEGTVGTCRLQDFVDLMCISTTTEPYLHENYDYYNEEPDPEKRPPYPEQQADSDLAPQKHLEGPRGQSLGKTRGGGAALQRDNDIPKKVIIENSEVQERGKEKSIKVAKYGQELFRNSNCIILDEDGPTPRGSLWMHHGTITSIYMRYPDMPIVQPEWTKMSTGTAEEQKKSVYDWERYMSQIVRPHLIAKRLNAKATIDPPNNKKQKKPKMVALEDVYFSYADLLKISQKAEDMGLGHFCPFQNDPMQAAGTLQVKGDWYFDDKPFSPPPPPTSDDVMPPPGTQDYWTQRETRGRQDILYVVAICANSRMNTPLTADLLDVQRTDGNGRLGIPEPKGDQNGFGMLLLKTAREFAYKANIPFMMLSSLRPPMAYYHYQHAFEFLSRHGYSLEFLVKEYQMAKRLGYVKVPGSGVILENSLVGWDTVQTKVEEKDDGSRPAEVRWDHDSIKRGEEIYKTKVEEAGIKIMGLRPDKAIQAAKKVLVDDRSKEDFDAFLRSEAVKNSKLLDTYYGRIHSRGIVLPPPFPPPGKRTAGPNLTLKVDGHSNVDEPLREELKARDLFYCAFVRDLLALYHDYVAETVRDNRTPAHGKGMPARTILELANGESPSPDAAMDVTMILLRRYDNAELRAAVDDYFGDEDEAWMSATRAGEAVVGDRNRQLEFVNNWVDHALRKDAPWKAEWKPLTTPMESYPVTNRPTPCVEAMHREVFKQFVMKPYVIHRLHERLWK